MFCVAKYCKFHSSDTQLKRHLTIGQVHWSVMFWHNSLCFLCRSGYSGSGLTAATLKPASEIWNMSFGHPKEAWNVYESAVFMRNTCINRPMGMTVETHAQERIWLFTWCSHMHVKKQGDLLTCDLCSVHVCCHETIKDFRQMFYVWQFCLAKWQSLVSH